MASKKEWLKGSFFKTFIKRLQMDDVSGLAAQLSYFFLLSLFPLLIFLFTLLAYLPFSQEDILNTISTYAPAGSMKIIEANLSEVMEANSTLLSFGVIGTIWSASNGMNAIIKAFNQAYGVKESRTFFISRGMSILLTLAMIFVFIVVLLLPIFGKQIGVFLFAEIGQSESTALGDQHACIFNSVHDPLLDCAQQKTEMPNRIAWFYLCNGRMEPRFPFVFFLCGELC
jgi:membrane protein